MNAKKTSVHEMDRSLTIQNIFYGTKTIRKMERNYSVWLDFVPLYVYNGLIKGGMEEFYRFSL